MQTKKSPACARDFFIKNINVFYLYTSHLTQILITDIINSSFSNLYIKRYLAILSLYLFSSFGWSIFISSKSVLQIERIVSCSSISCWYFDGIAKNYLAADFLKTILYIC